MSTSLARLAVDTGGRFTERTNDLSLGYARAQHDQACVHTLGFYVEGLAEDRLHGVTVRMRPKGLRAIHAAQYVFRSESELRRSLLQAAWFAPEMFETGVVRAHVFPLRPASAEAWNGLLAVTFPVPLAEARGQKAVREFGAVLVSGTTVRHQFSRRVSLLPESSEVTSEPRVTFLEPVRLRPGRHELTAVLSDPAGGRPHSIRVDVEVPPIPKRELFVVPPVLGRRAGANLVVRGSGPGGTADEIVPERGFEPLLLQLIEEPTDLVALTQACLVLPRKKGAGKRLYEGRRLERALVDAQGRAVGEIGEVELALEAAGGVACQNLVDILPVGSVTAGEYVFEAWLEGPGEPGTERERVRFAVGPSSGP